MRGLPRSNAFGKRGQRTDGHNRRLEIDELLPLLVLNAQGLRAFKVGLALNDLHIAHLGQLGHARPELGENRFLPHPQLRQIHRGRRERDAAMIGFPGRSDLVRGVEQCLGRNAAAIQANPAEPFVALDEHDFLAQVRRVKGRRVSAGASAENYNFSFDWIHRKN